MLFKKIILCFVVFVAFSATAQTKKETNKITRVGITIPVLAYASVQQEFEQNSNTILFDVGIAPLIVVGLGNFLSEPISLATCFSVEGRRYLVNNTKATKALPFVGLQSFFIVKNQIAYNGNYLKAGVQQFGEKRFFWSAQCGYNMFSFSKNNQTSRFLLSATLGIRISK